MAFARIAARSPFSVDDAGVASPGRSPLSNSCINTPSAYTSVAVVTAVPVYCSGAA